MTKKLGSKDDWDFITEVASEREPGKVYRIESRKAGRDCFAAPVHGTMVRCTCLGFVFKTKNGSGELCKHLDYFRLRPQQWADVLGGAGTTVETIPTVKAPTPAVTTQSPTIAALQSAVATSFGATRLRRIIIEV